MIHICSPRFSGNIDIQVVRVFLESFDLSAWIPKCQKWGMRDNVQKLQVGMKRTVILHIMKLLQLQIESQERTCGL